MADEVNWYDSLFSEGELGSAQLKRLKEILSSAEVSKCLYRIIYLHHHPFHPRLFHQLKDSEKLHEVLKDFSIDAILFGHNHDGRIWNGHWGIKRAYDGGTATGKMGKDNPHRVIDFSLSPDRDYDAHF
jgi:3',5'-cyclic AMP phosphodiesterase CpdA